MSKDKKETAKKQEEIEEKICGLVMPISAIDGCDEQHWLDVKEILEDAIKSAGFSANLVSYADEAGIIQKRIIRNLYNNPIVVCDVSGKNPNVMFELGMRLAFDKPTIIIKDDKTSYSFDTSPIEHLEYPRDLRFSKIVDFKNELERKIVATFKKSTEDKDYTAFLKHFGTFKIAQLETTEVSEEKYILEELKDIKKIVSNFKKVDVKPYVDPWWSSNNTNSKVSDLKEDRLRIEVLEAFLRREKDIRGMKIEKVVSIVMDDLKENCGRILGAVGYEQAIEIIIESYKQHF